MPKTVHVPTKKKRVAVEIPVEVKRGRGRPRKELSPVAESIKKGLDQVLAYAKGDKKAGRVVHVASKTSGKKLKAVKESPVVDRRRKSRVHNSHLLLTDGESNRVQLPATRVIEQLTSMLERAEVQQFRGRRERPQLILSMLENQALQEAKVLFELKLSMQRDGQLRRKRVG